LSNTKSLLLLYASYRSVVRAKVTAITAIDPDNTSTTDRDAAQRRSRNHWTVALQLILPARLRTGWVGQHAVLVANRCRLVLVSGLPGSGKSTVARSLSSLFTGTDHVVVLRTDTVRKEALLLTAAAPVSYTTDSKAHIYSIVLDRARQALHDRKLVLVDATFNLDGQVRRFQQLAHDDWSLFAILLCQCRDEDETRRRLSSRTGDASDADCKSCWCTTGFV
jgi:predicted kinase